jgi:hypothetical protein
VLCPGWVRTGIAEAERNWPSKPGESPPLAAVSEVLLPYYERALRDGTPPAAIADLVAEAIEATKFWILPHREWLELVVRRWHRIAAGEDREATVDAPGFPPARQIATEIQAAMASTSG